MGKWVKNYLMLLSYIIPKNKVHPDRGQAVEHRPRIEPNAKTGHYSVRTGKRSGIADDLLFSLAPEPKLSRA